MEAGKGGGGLRGGPSDPGSGGPQRACARRPELGAHAGCRPSRTSRIGAVRTDFNAISDRGQAPEG